MINNINLFNDKLTALKISGYYLKTIDSAFYLDHYIYFNPDVTINRIKSRLNDISIFFDGTIILGMINNNIVIRETKKDRQKVDFMSILNNSSLRSSDGLPIICGKDDKGKDLYIDLCKMPHLLIAGATGSGKSVFLHNCIISLLQGNKAELFLIDVKKVEFSFYDGIGGMINKIAYDPRQAEKMLKTLCDIMDNRYNSMKNDGVRTFEDWQKIHPEKHYLTVVIDEIADLFIQDKKTIEKYIIRLCQLGRAAGIHCILATQRPSHEVLSGLIRDNVPSRVAFSVQNKTASRIIIDTSGAEKLGGKGDGLLKINGSDKNIRFQSAYISDNDILNYAKHYSGLRFK